MFNSLTPRETAICARLTAEAEQRGMTVGELAAVIISKMESHASCGIARVATQDDPRPLVGAFGE